MGCARLRPSLTRGTQTDSSGYFLESERKQPYPVTAPTVCIKLFEDCDCVPDDCQSHIDNISILEREINPDNASGRNSPPQVPTAPISKTAQT